MRQYIIRRLLQMIPIVILLSLLIFFVFHLAPGDMVDSMAANNPHMTQAKVKQLKHLYHFDRPLIIQYGYWISGVFHGTLGDSYKYGQPVWHVMTTYIWNSFYLSLFAFILQYIIAVPIGVVSATKQYSFYDMFFTVFALIGISIPAFFFALLLMKWFAVDNKIFPVTGMRTLGSHYTGLRYLVDVLYHMFLPVIVLALQGVASTMRYTRTSMLEVIRQDYIRTARSKGLREKVVIYKHALRNGLIPIITLLGFQLAGLFSGAIMTEQIFQWPGIGPVTLYAVNNRDYQLLMGITVFLAILTLIGNLIADVLYAMVDPRIRLE